jgi:hypothetical protein
MIKMFWKEPMCTRKDGSSAKNIRKIIVKRLTDTYPEP